MCVIFVPCDMVLHNVAFEYIVGVGWLKKEEEDPIYFAPRQSRVIRVNGSGMR